MLLDGREQTLKRKGRKFASDGQRNGVPSMWLRTNRCRRDFERCRAVIL